MPHRRLVAHLVARPLLTGTLLALLFAVQLGALGVVDVFPDPGQNFQREVDAAIVMLGLRPLILALVPAAMLTWLLTRWVYRRLARHGIRGPEPLHLTAGWVLAWLLGWFSVYEIAAPENMADWSFALFSMPLAWYGLVAMGLALWAGAREGLSLAPTA
jgi:hypothetical protein